MQNSIGAKTLKMQNLIKGDTFLKQITDNIAQVIWLRDIDTGCFDYATPSFEQIWGLPVERLYADQKVLIDSIHPEDRVQVMAADSRRDLKPFEQTYRILRSNGSQRWIHTRIFLICDESGEPSHHFCIAQDISDRMQVELTLRKTLTRTREQFNLSRKLILARKPQAVLKTLMSVHEWHSAQRAAMLFFEKPQVGPSRGVELVASWKSNQDLAVWSSESNFYEEPAFYELLKPTRLVVIKGIKSDVRLTPSVRDFLLDGQINTLVIFPLVASGVWLGSLLVYYQDERNFDRTELRHLKVLVDQATLTLYNLRLLEVEEESRHEAERANEIKTEFLAMISHELRTPLTSIIGFTNTLIAEDVTWKVNEQKDFINTIQKEANRLQELIDHLLDLSRLEAGMLPISRKPHSLQEIIEDAMPQFQSLKNGRKLTVQLPSNLPLVDVDAKRIAQVLVNLVRNASAYSPKGTEISITVSVRGGCVQVNVSDQGLGIPVHEHKKVFKAFQRGVHTENGSTKGAGLGLAICKGLVEAHGGRIWIRKKDTPGTTISFTIPLVSALTPLDAEKEKA